jgi:hypothetical protein
MPDVPTDADGQKPTELPSTAAVAPEVEALQIGPYRLVESITRRRSRP